MPASSSVVWPAYGAVRARDVGRDRMDLMYSPMLRYGYIIVNSSARRDAVHRPGAATLLLRTKLTPYCSAQRNDCAYAMNPASDVDGRMVCSWLLYMSRYAHSMLDMLTRCAHSHGTALTLRRHMALAETSRTAKGTTQGGRMGGASARCRRVARERVQRYSITVSCVSTISRLSTSSDVRPARARISHILLC